MSEPRDHRHQKEHADPPEDQGAPLDLKQELQIVKAHNVELEDRLVRIETIVEKLTRHVKTLTSPQQIESTHETIDKYITDYIQERLDEEQHEVVEDLDVEGVETNWHYFVAKKGGYDEVLYMTVQDFLTFEKDPVQFLAFLLKKRDEEVSESLQHLQTEYGKLEGHQLQQHFTELWELHHNLLKKKLIRTWKEEIFLEAFEAFLSWIQK
ncbi:hypothetical protein GF339_15460 [candidate division KSB3 bacterium]|uniref:Uncharacterized protein n=1 Tax=candidate division KSB3 bacterium TaxID=2044937 RepID=A0A9D5Q7J9_9BACT|nr:hypothetical protein [candidate division KSB3 bacterium]MBD3325981.1 hypothetical protein [candidate division KSB3 bacterium]